MDVLLRERRTRTDGFVEFTDTEISAAAVNVGSAPDQTLQLIGRYVAPRHAQLRLAGDTLRIDCRRGQRVSVNGKSVASSALAEGDVVELDGHRIQIVTAPPGFDVALELTPNSNVRSADFERAFVTDLERTWLPKRSAAWILFVSVLALTLLVPLGKFVWQSEPEEPSPLAALGQAMERRSSASCTPSCHRRRLQRMPRRAVRQSSRRRVHQVPRSHARSRRDVARFARQCRTHSLRDVSPRTR